jgi:hypothetical protein
LEFDNFKSPLKSGIFKRISWLNDSFFGVDDLGFRKEGVKTCLMAPISHLKTPFFSVFTSIVYGITASLFQLVLHVVAVFSS